MNRLYMIGIFNKSKEGVTPMKIFVIKMEWKLFCEIKPHIINGRMFCRKSNI